MKIHHTKHHQTYISNLNNALTALATATSSSDIVTHLYLQAAISFNAGGHINHTLFWENLTPATSPSAQPSAAPKLMAAINSRWGSIESFQEKFTAALLGIKGSGWGWLTQDVGSGDLEIVTTKDQEFVAAGKKPILGVDFWEHAYYLQYLNNKALYATEIWKVVNWAKIEARFVGGVENIYGDLKGLRSGL